HLGFHLPHTPVLPPKSVRDRFRKHTYDIPEFDQAEFDDMPEQLQVIHNVGQVDEMTPDEMQQMAQDYYAFCAHGDALLGRAVEAFKQHSEASGRPWLILFQVGDHGWHLGEQGISAKFSPWHQSVGNALIVVSSDKSLFPAGQVNRQLVEYVDVKPTLLQAAGADLADDVFEHLDGYSLLDVHNGVHAERAYALGEISVVAGPRAYLHTDRFRFSMRTRPFNGSPPPDMIGRDIEWALNAPVEDVDLALYDLAVDPLERDNVANDPEYRELAAFLRDKLGRIVLGDGRVEVDWSKPNTYARSNFAAGADDKKLDIPPAIIPVAETAP
ncbi:MAG: sulfatase-like hydrolase/transferase, partial [Planctomycetota bacterium]